MKKFLFLLAIREIQTIKLLTIKLAKIIWKAKLNAGTSDISRLQRGGEN